MKGSARNKPARMRTSNKDTQRVNEIKLREAAKSNDHRKVRDILACGTDPNAQDEVS